MEFNSSQAIRHIDRKIWLLCIKLSSKDTPCAHSAVMFTPGIMIILSVCDGNCCTVAAPSNTDDLEMIIALLSYAFVFA